jgi:hypothetical protein
VWTGTELLIWGGTEDGGPEAGDGAAYDPVTRTWTPMPASPLSPRDWGAPWASGSAVWTGTRALLWGGENGNGSLLMNGASYDPAGRTWAMLPAALLPPDPDGSRAIVWTGTHMVVIQPGTSAAFDPATNSWTTAPGLPLAIDSAEWTGSEVIAWAGRGAQGLSAYAWVPGSGAWTSLPGQPGGGWPFGTAASAGGRLLFLGGVMPCGALCPAANFGDGDWFDPSSGRWISLPEKFSGGFGPAVWTGSAMVVFATKAGASPSPRYGTPHGPPVPAGAAAAFDPSTGAWTDLASCPLPDLTNAEQVQRQHRLRSAYLPGDERRHQQRADDHGRKHSRARPPMVVVAYYAEDDPEQARLARVRPGRSSRVADARTHADLDLSVHVSPPHER